MAPQAYRLGKNHPGAAQAATVTALAALCACGPSTEPPATPGPFGGLGAVTIRGYSGDAMEPFITRVENIVTGTPSLWRTSRPTPQDAFGVPEQVTAAAGFVEGPTLSPDGRSLYFHRLENGTFKICRVSR